MKKIFTLILALWAISTFAAEPVVGDTLRYAYKGNNLYYKIENKTSSYKSVAIVNDGTAFNEWTEGNKPTGTLVIPDSIEDEYGTKYVVSAMHQYVFKDCTGLTSVDFSENHELSYVVSQGFRGCTSLASVTLSDAIRYLYSYCFSNCPLTSIDLKNVESIDGPGNFDDSNIASVHIPKSLIQIPNQIRLFNHATTITCDPENPKYVAIDNVLYSKDTTKLITLPLGQTETTLHIPATVTSMLYQSMNGFAGTLVLYSQIKPDYEPDERNSPVGDLQVNCGLLEFYTTGNNVGWHGNFSRVTSVTEGSYYKLTLKDVTGGTIKSETTANCGEYKLTASTDDGYKFVQWFDGSTENPHVITPTGNWEVYAVYEEDKPTGIEQINQEPRANSQKLFENGQFIIIKNGVRYNAQGQEIQ